jgi:hypothetical protein
MGAAIAAGALALGGGAASAAKPKTHKTPVPKPVPVSVTCKINVTAVAPAGQPTFIPASETGDEFGTSSCPGAEGKGAAHMTFSLQDDGDLTGSFWEWFGTGSVHGTYVLTPSQPATLNPNNFASSDFAGTLQVTGGTGAFKPAVGKGTLTCTSPDSVHFSCSAPIKFSELVPPIIVGSSGSGAS